MKRELCTVLLIVLKTEDLCSHSDLKVPSEALFKEHSNRITVSTLIEL